MDTLHAIHTVEEARDFFIAMGCNDFHMQRECPEKHEAFRAMRISEPTLARWRKEHLQAQLRLLTQESTPAEELWFLYFQVAELVCSQFMSPQLKQLYKATLMLQNRLSPMEKMLVAETIVGQHSMHLRTGLVLRCRQLWKFFLARKFILLARELISDPFPDHDLNPLSGERTENRRLALLERLKCF